MPSRFDPDEPTATEVPAVSPKATPPPRPGLLVVWEAGRPACRPVPYAGATLTIGRDPESDVCVADRSVSRDHARFGADRGRLWIEDAGSRAGVRVDGTKIQQRAWLAGATVVKLGDVLLLVTADAGAFERHPASAADGYVVGPALASCIAAAELAGATGRTLLVTGESGAGKERLALAYHRAGPSAAGPFVDVNCAVLDKELARADLFGAKKGAYSGCDADRDGFLVQADGGTLFLDEVGELALDVQAMLLRAIETKRTTPIGGKTAREVDVGVVCATNRDLRAMVEAGELRRDLFERISQSRVRVPPLRDRREEIPHLVAIAAERAWERLKATPQWRRRGAEVRPTAPSLVQACLLAGWNGGNVRALMSRVGDAVHAAFDEGAAVVGAEHLHEIHVEQGEAETDPEEDLLARFAAALARHGGNVVRAGAECGVKKTKAYALLKEIEERRRRG